MRRIVLLLVFHGAIITTHAQVLKQMDSADSGTFNDSIYGQINSIHSRFIRQTDSIKTRYIEEAHLLDSLRGIVNGVEPLGAADSMLQSTKQKLARLSLQIDYVASGALKELNAIKSQIRLPEYSTFITPSIKGIRVKSVELILSDLWPPNGPFDNVKDINGPFRLLSEVEQISDIGALESKILDISTITDDLKAYQWDVGESINIDLHDLNALESKAEQRALQLTGLDEAMQGAKSLDPLIESMKDPEALKEEVIAQARDAVVDHFTDKQKELQSAMETISKLKKKFLSLNSLAEIPKKKPNEMRGKPIIERLLPGIAIQLQKKVDYVFSDFNLYLGYRFTTKITAGAGWNQRVGYDTQSHGWVPEDTRIFGPRIFGEYNLSKGFAPRVDLEAMNTFVPPYFKTGNADPGKREWVWGVFAGMKKDYKFYKNLRGTTQVMFRLFDPHRKSPYADVLNVRFGFELPVKRKSDKRA